MTFSFGLKQQLAIMFVIRVLFVASAVSAGGVMCVMRHCSRLTAACLSDGACQANLACNMNCGGGGVDYARQCVERCMKSLAPSKNAVSLGKCLDKHKCWEGLQWWMRKIQRAGEKIQSMKITKSVQNMIAAIPDGRHLLKGKARAEV